MSSNSDTRDVQHSGGRHRLSWRKKLAFSFATTLLFFAVLEGVLAMFGIAPAIDTSDPFLGFVGSSPLFVPDTESVDSTRMVTAPSKLAYFNKQSFSHAKPTGTFRIFCLGGSTTYGRPYDDATSFAGWLRELLPRVAPEVHWEVINAGGVSYASYRVARLAEELITFEPDLLIVYTGQNEFLEDRTYRDIRQRSPFHRHVEAALAQTRTFAVAHRLFGRRNKPACDAELFQMSGEVDAALDHTVGPTSYTRDDDQRRRILKHFEINVTRIVHLAHSVGANVVFVTPASNLKDCKPFKSQHSDGLSDQQRTNWQEIYETGRQLERERKFEDALAAYGQAEQIDPRFAELHWRIGRVQLQQKQFDTAHAAFRRAVDEDVCPLRAVSDVLQIIRHTAKRLNVPVVDFEQLIAEQCRQQLGHSSPGAEFFLDHVHPTIETNGRLATTIVQQLIDAGIAEPDTPLTEDVMTAVSRKIDSQIDAHQHAIALRNLAKVLNWAGKHAEAGSLAMRAVEQLPNDAETLVLSAAYLAETGRRDQAIKHYRRALRQRPDYATAHQMLAAALVDNGKLNEALKHFTTLAELRPDDAYAWQMIGAIHGEQRHFDEALPNYMKAVALNPNDANIHYNLANTLSHLGRRPDAIKHYRRAAKLNPNDADAHNNLGVMLMQVNRTNEAIRHFRHVLRIRPNDNIAAINLRDCEQSQRESRKPGSD